MRLGKLLIIFLAIVFLGLLYFQLFRRDGFSDSVCPTCPTPPKPIKVSNTVFTELMGTTPGFTWEPRPGF